MKKTSIAAVMAAATLLLFSACGKKSAADGYVDLGLPSGLLWASCNLGADTPEGFGDYYAWGETSPKKVYDEESYQLDTAKYGWSTGKTELDASDDVATQKLGKGYRIPTVGDWNELLEHTTMVQTTVNDVPGYTFMGSNGNSIFLPAAGNQEAGERKNYKKGGENGLYWSSTHYFKKVVDKDCPLFDNGGPVLDEYGEPVLCDVIVYNTGAYAFFGSQFVSQSEYDEDYHQRFLGDDDYYWQLFHGLSVRPVFDWKK